MKLHLPRRNAICITLLTTGIVVFGYICCRMLISQKKWKVPITSSVLDSHEAKLPNIRKRADSLRCDAGGSRGNKRHDNGQPYLSCHQIKEVTLEKKIGEGLVKQVGS